MQECKQMKLDIALDAPDPLVLLAVPVVLAPDVEHEDTGDEEEGHHQHGHRAHLGQLWTGGQT